MPAMDVNEHLNEEKQEQQGGGSNYGLLAVFFAIATVIFGITSIVLGVILMSLTSETDSPQPDGNGGEPIATPPGADRISIIMFNDVYELQPIPFAHGEQGGVARAQTIINEVREANPGRTFTLFAGDLLSPSAWSSVTEGAQMIDLMNEMGLDVACLGNHEFDFGLKIFDERIAESKFPWVNVNFLDAVTGNITNGTVHHAIKEITVGDNTVKIGFFGAGFDFRQSVSRDTHLMDFKEIIAASREAVANLKAAGCSVIVAITHQFNNDDCRLSAELGEDLDLIVGGHDHTARIDMDCGGAVYVKGDSDLKSMWIIDMYLTPEGTVAHSNFNFRTVDETLPEDPEIKAAVDRWGTQVEELFAQPVGCSVEPLDATNLVRTREMPIGNLFTDSTRFPPDQDPEFQLDAVIMNGGGIRGNRVYPATLTYGDVRAMHPFGNTVIKLMANGSSIRRTLEIGASCYETVCGEFTQVSGLVYTMDLNQDPMSRITSLTLDNGTAIEDDKHYRIGVASFLYDTTPILAAQPFFDMNQPNDAKPIVDYVMAYVRAAGDDCVHPIVDQNSPRITVLGVSSEVAALHLEVREAKMLEEAAKHDRTAVV